MKKHLLRVFLLLAAVVLFGVAEAGTVTYVYTDPQGTPLAEADANGNITATFDYRPYGAQALGAPKDGPGYTGHVNDAASGFVYMQARYYDPEVGRFLSVDPVAAYEKPISNFNRYVYALDNPSRFTDPDGRQALDQSARYLAVYRDCAATPGCNPATVPDHIAQIEKPYADAAGLFVPAEDALVGLTRFAGFLRFAPAIRLQRQVAEAFTIAGKIAKNGAGRIFKLAEGKITVRVMEKGGGRTNYMRVSIEGKGSVDAAGNLASDPKVTHIAIDKNSLQTLARIVEKWTK
ncbi:RHS repeat-associated core domain-containing protein [Fulvimonas yonginensis]|uniref:RHS repeat-associated core domain-containing protein n=1 Tax=Fulvimonas yonginensis TaxID=1495200 RepID=A0ABU8JFA4_9GAMM